MTVCELGTRMVLTLAWFIILGAATILLARRPSPNPLTSIILDVIGGFLGVLVLLTIWNGVPR